ncbi:MAG: hypothetical protein COA96_03570 [SAR86 cluster bacterium]|uniref:NodB homology domain-containing protein n=1 Tax=SAR86 cluster bacterium TaxID=2030880 RepID=A0A2A5B724_9GAMM|nr:MAG: hypothetical protein COA96_03570 [SAR86 cluster bacterium]
MKSKILNLLSNFAGFRRIKSPGNGLYCFNYHRIGSPDATQFDPNVFSCTAANFEKHLLYYKKEFRLIDINELCQLAKTKSPINEKLALITFDDGYIDNFTVALPLLKKHNMSAVFFLPTEFIGNMQIPWWDEAAWLIKSCTNDSVKLSNWSKPIVIDRSHLHISIREVLKCLKAEDNISMKEKLSELYDVLQIEEGKSPNDERLFLNWDEVKELCAAGMGIGSHSNSHKILSHLPLAEQKQEILVSIQVLQEKLNMRVSAFAYPVGGENTYSPETINLLVAHDIDVAFTFIEGVNTNLFDNRYELGRIPVYDNPDPSSLLKY